MIEVTAAIIEEGDKFLIARRAKGKHLAGYWEFPGGKIEAGETAEACLSRELNEEFQINVSVNNFVGESVYEYPNKKIILKAFTCRIISGEIQLNDHDKIEWITIDEIKQYDLAPADIPLIRLYDKARNNR
ncbi:8-oxo-dGTP diphosphatase [Formosa sp. Hel1_31_208]|uniref:8-oxo-dGTP diphosphatase MutT n=1 Tax=Formosa sp. Hel1_31_208 TaxID=1798225 RepID=UPI00087AC98C|nr:8-oxo-dGTP diphosphatase MutT [Formosa sp. Hel1_31_208]SDS50088.1 8-oxo-dGTP diphosphatase [Formosa sp. Hel1_31_208]